MNSILVMKISPGRLMVRSLPRMLAGPSHPFFLHWAKQRFYAFVDDVLAQLAANSLMDKILYVEMGNGSAEEFANPYLNVGGQLKVGSWMKPKLYRHGEPNIFRAGILDRLM